MTDEELRLKIAACAKCGSCRAVCTLYPERRSERAVARGKIALIESTIVRDDDRIAAVRDALADCLLCGRCERNCPNQVAVEEILVAGRVRLAEKMGLSAWKRLLFGGMLPSASIRGAIGAAGGFTQKLLLSKVPTESGLHYRFPDTARFHGRTLPALPSKGFVASLPAEEAIRGDAMLFVGCVFDIVMPEIGRAAYETMKASGASVRVPRETACCGLPALASGDREAALVSVTRNISLIRAESPGAVVFPCGSCLTMFRRETLSLIPEGHPLRADAEWVAERSVDYATFILGTRLAARLDRSSPNGEKGSVGWHDPCHLSGTLGRGGAARELLTLVAGGSFGEMAGASLCCGYGGTFNVRDYPTSAKLGANKVSLAAQGGTSTIVTACSGCILQLRDMAARHSPQTKVRHLAEIISARLPR